MKILRRCQNPDCSAAFFKAGGEQGYPLETTRKGEYVMLRCKKCGARSIWNPVSKIHPEPAVDKFVRFDDKREPYELRSFVRVVKP